MATEDGIQEKQGSARLDCLRSSPEDLPEAEEEEEERIAHGVAPFIGVTERTFGINNSRMSGIRKET